MRNLKEFFLTFSQILLAHAKFNLHSILSVTLSPCFVDWLLRKAMTGRQAGKQEQRRRDVLKCVRKERGLMTCLRTTGSWLAAVKVITLYTLRAGSYKLTTLWPKQKRNSIKHSGIFTPTLRAAPAALNIFITLKTAT